MRRILLIIVIIGLGYYGWLWLRPVVIKFVCQNIYNGTLTSASQLKDTAGKVNTMCSEAEEAYQSCLQEWGIEESGDSEE